VQHRLPRTDTSRRVARLLDELCSNGDCAATESEFLRYAERSGGNDVFDWRNSVNHAVSDGWVCREIIDNETLLFPRDLRTAELTIARCSRHLAEGSTAKLRIVNSESAGLTIDYVVQQARSDGTGSRVTILAVDLDAARWFAMKCSQPISTLHAWISGEPEAQRTIKTPISTRTASECINHFVLLDASRLGVEGMSEFLDRVPSSSFVTFVGNESERPRGGHGQPFHDLLHSGVFNSKQLQVGRAVWGNPIQSAPQAIRRGGLYWRLKRATS
jgi:hypothetical protein